MTERPTRILFVCSGNICRSPTAEAVMRHLVHERGLDGEIEVDGAGTGAWHVGSPPDERATHAAAHRGIELGGTARQVSVDDFTDFDLILAVDGLNLEELRRIAPPATTADIRLLDDADVPDPYYGGASGFDDVLTQITAACERLLDELT